MVTTAVDTEAMEDTATSDVSSFTIDFGKGVNRALDEHSNTSLARLFLFLQQTVVAMEDTVAMEGTVDTEATVWDTAEDTEVTPTLDMVEDMVEVTDTDLTPLDTEAMVVATVVTEETGGTIKHPAR